VEHWAHFLILYNPLNRQGLFRGSRNSLNLISEAQYHKGRARMREWHRQADAPTSSPGPCLGRLGESTHGAAGVPHPWGATQRTHTPLRLALAWAGWGSPHTVQPGSPTRGVPPSGRAAAPLTPSGAMMQPSSARAEMTTLPQVDTKCTTLSLIPRVNGNTARSFSTHGQQSAAKGSLTIVSRSDIRLIQRKDSSADGLVRRWRLIGYLPIHVSPLQVRAR
jgi:hypothetical protein